MLLRILITSLLATALCACGRTGPLYLTPDYIAKHQTPTQPVAPSTTIPPISASGI